MKQIKINDKVYSDAMKNKYGDVEQYILLKVEEIHDDYALCSYKGDGQTKTKKLPLESLEFVRE